MRMDKLTSRFQQALADAQSLAVGRDNPAIEPAHLMQALLDRGDGSTLPLLQNAGVNTDLLRSKLSQLLERLPRLGDNNGQNVDYAPSGYGLGNYTFNWFNPLVNNGAGAWVADSATFGEAGITEGTAGSFATFMTACFAAALHCAGRVRRAHLDTASEQTAQALKASVLVGATSMALFDGLGFPMAAGMLFLMVGLCGAAWRLTRDERPATVPHASHAPAAELAWSALAGSLLQVGGTVGAIGLCWWFQRHRFLALALLFACAVPVVATIGYAGLTSPTALLVATFFAGFLVLGIQTGLNGVGALIYPTSLRANGSGWQLGIGRIGSIVGPLAGAVLIGWPVEHLYLWGAVPFLAAAVICFIVHRLNTARLAAHPELRNAQ